MKEVKKVQDAVIANLKARDTYHQMTEKDKVEFLAGAMTVMHNVFKTEEDEKSGNLAKAIPPLWVIAIMSGTVEDLLVGGEKSSEGEIVH